MKPAISHNFSKIHKYSDAFMNTNNHECLGSDLVDLREATIRGIDPLRGGGDFVIYSHWHLNFIPPSLGLAIGSKYPVLTISNYSNEVAY
jgi:hypothetical protein